MSSARAASRAGTAARTVAGFARRTCCAPSPSPPSSSSADRAGYGTLLAHSLDLHQWLTRLPWRLLPDSARALARLPSTHRQVAATLITAVPPPFHCADPRPRGSQSPFVSGRISVRPPQISAIFKIGLGLVQCLSTLRCFSKVRWPDSFAALIQAVDLFLIEAFSVVPAECIVGRRLGFFYELAPCSLCPDHLLRSHADGALGLRLRAARKPTPQVSGAPAATAHAHVVVHSCAVAPRLGGWSCGSKPRSAGRVARAASL